MLVINDLEWTKTCLEFGPLWAASSSYEGSSFGPLKVTLSCSAYEGLIDDMGNGVQALFAGVSTQRNAVPLWLCVATASVHVSQQARITNSPLNHHHQWAPPRLRWLPQPRWLPRPRYPNREDTSNAWIQMFLRLLMTRHSVQAALVSLPTAHCF